MSTDVQVLKQVLKTHGHSLTASRVHVFNALVNHDPQTMTELLQRCTVIDRASVYRTVVLFETIGVVQRVTIGWKYKLELTDQFHRHHHHLSCQTCGAIITLPEDPALEARLHDLATAHHFDMRSHQLEIQGVCESCSKT